MIWKCDSCNQEREHKVSQADMKRYKIIECECGHKEMIPIKVLEEGRKQEVEVKSVSVDSERNIDDGCESGLCPSR